MGEITPNLDDGQVWLPSDILPLQIFSNKFDSNFSTQLNEFIEEEEEEATSLPHLPPSYSLFEQNHINSKVPAMDLDRNSKQIRPQNQLCGMGKTQPQMGLGLYGDSYFESSPFQFHERNKVPLPIVWDILQARAMILRRQQIMEQRYVERVQNYYYDTNHFLPLQVNNGSWNSGFHRGYKGTGVFIPRTPPTIVANPGEKQSFLKEEESIDTDKRLGGGLVKRPNPPTDNGVFGSVLNY